MRTWFLLSTAALLSGCATQQYQARPLDPAELAKSYETRTLDSAQLHQFILTSLGQDVTPWPPKSWSGQMLTLAAFYYSPDLDAARAKWGTAKAGIVTAAQRPNPTLQLPFQHTTGSSGSSPWTFGLGLDIPIETAGKRGYRVAQAQQLSDAARFSIGNVAWQVRSRLRAQLLNLYTAIRKTSILEQQIEAQSQIVKMLEQRLSVGEASATDVNQQRISLIQSRTDLANAQKQMGDARAQVASAIGVPVSAVDGIHISFAEFARIVVILQGEWRAFLLVALADSTSCSQLDLSGHHAAHPRRLADGPASPAFRAADRLDRPLGDFSADPKADAPHHHLRFA